MSLRSNRATSQAAPRRRQSRNQFADRDQRARHRLAPRDACADLRLEGQQISRRAQESDRVVVEKSETTVARPTKQRAHDSPAGTVIDAQCELGFAPAYRASAALLRQHALVILQ